MSEYYYLVSSLPMLRNGEAPPMSTAEYLEQCEEWVSEDEFNTLKNLALVPEENSSGAVKQWYDWEICLRNRLASHLGNSLNLDAEEYTLEEADCYSEIERGLQEAYGQKNPLDRERVLDNLRWSRLEDMESGHLFDINLLCIYKIKLMLCEKWVGREPEHGNENLDAIIEKVVTA